MIKLVHIDAEEVLMVLTAISDEELVKSAQNGNKDAMDSIILRYKNLVYMIASRYYMQGFDNDDIIQEGMLGLYSAVLDYKNGNTKFKTFATMCITRKIISLLKSATRQKNIPLNYSVSLDAPMTEGSFPLSDILLSSDRKNPEAMVISSENLSHYEHGIKNNLSPFELKVLFYHLDGLTYRDIAKTLNKDVKSVDNAVQRIKKKLKSILLSDN